MKFGNGLSIYEDVATLPEEVSRFLDDHGGHDLFLSASWFRLIQRHSLPRETSVCVFVYRSLRDGPIDGVLFASTDRARPWYRARTLNSLTNFYTMSFAPIVRDGQVDVLRSFIKAVVDTRPGWGIIEFRSLPDGPATTGTISALRDAGLLADTFFQFENWYCPTSGLSGESYFRQRPSQLRNTVTRKTKKAQREHKVEFRLFRNPDGIESGIDGYQKVYAQSWKQPETYPNFIPELLRESARLGTLRLGLLYVDGEPAAAQIWLIAGDRATIYKLAYDDKFAALSVGSILTKLMFDEVLDGDQVREVDYGVGSEPYKMDWMTAKRHVLGIVAFDPRSPLGLLAAARHFGGKLLRCRGGMGVKAVISQEG